MTDDTVRIQHQDGAFRADAGGEELGELTYTRGKDGTVTLDHTGVRPAAEGKGVGKRLVQAAVEWARAEGVKVDPRCPFARKLIDRNPAWQDVLSGR